MENKSSKTAGLLASRKGELLDAWMAAQMAGTTLRENLMDKNVLVKESRDFLDEFLKAISSGNLEDIAAPEYDAITRMLADISVNRARMGFTPTETAVYVFSLKDAILQFLRTEYEKQPDVLNSELISSGR